MNALGCFLCLGTDPRLVIGFLFLLLAFAPASLSGKTTTWRGFRGQELSGFSPVPIRALHSSALPTLAWSVAIRGEGVSSPVTNDDLIFVTSSWRSDRARMLRMLVTAVWFTIPILQIFGSLRRPATGSGLLIVSSSVAALSAIAWWPGSECWLHSQARTTSAIAFQVCMLVITATLRSRPALTNRVLLASALLFTGIWLYVSVFGIGMPADITPGRLFLLVQSVATITLGLVNPLTLRRITASGTSTAALVACVACPILLYSAGGINRTEAYVRAVIAIDRSSGRTRWTYAGLEGPAGPMHNYNTPATPTPVLNDTGIFAYFGSAGLVALTLDGRLKWQRTDLPFQGPHGAGSSLLEESGIVVLSSGGGQNSYVTALDSSSGKTLWKHDLRQPRGTDALNRTPSILSWQSAPILLLWDSNRVTGLDLRTGNSAFVLPMPRGFYNSGLISSAAVRGDSIYFAGMNGVVKQKTNMISSQSWPHAWFSKGPGTDCASPVVTGTSVFAIDETGMVSTRDTTTGALQWEETLEGGEFYASPIADDDRVLFCSRSGLCTVTSAVPPFRVLGTFDAGGDVLASPAVHGGRLYLRAGNRLAAYR